MNKLIYPIISLLILCCISCGKPTADSNPNKKTLRIAFAYDPLSIDPRKCNDPVSCNFCFMLYEGLTHLNPDGTTALAVANKVEISKDLKTYTFYLKQTFWTDGSLLTAHDFEASWKSILDPQCTSSSGHLLFPIKNAKDVKTGHLPIEKLGVQALDNEILIVTLERPTPYFLNLLAYCSFFPIHPNNINGIIHKDSVISNGPFKLGYWNYNDEASVRKNSNYFAAHKVILDEIHISIIKDENTSLQMYENGELDWIGGFISPISLDALEHLSKSGELLHKPIGGSTFCTFNLERFPLNNRNIRKGLSLAIDRHSIVKNITSTNEDIATGIVPPVLKRHVPSVPYFIDAHTSCAKQYFERGLKELGMEIKDFPILTYSYFASELQKKIALAIQSQWRQTLGIHVQLQVFELKVFLDHLHRRNYHIAHMSLITQYPDQMNVLERFKYLTEHKNYCGWSNQQYIDLLDQSYFSVNEDERLQLLSQAEEILICDMPIAPLYHYTLFYLQKPMVNGIEISPLGHVQFKTVFLEKL